MARISLLSSEHAPTGLVTIIEEGSDAHTGESYYRVVNRVCPGPLEMEEPFGLDLRGGTRGRLLIKTVDVDLRSRSSGQSSSPSSARRDRSKAGLARAYPRGASLIPLPVDLHCKNATDGLRLGEARRELAGQSCGDRSTGRKETYSAVW